MNHNNYKRNLWEKIKSKYILKQIFESLKQKKLLEIIRYNKAIRCKLSKRKNDYFKEYSKIEIEIIPIENHYGTFINFKYDYESYYHIYFNDNETEEIKRYYINENENISKNIPK